MRTTILLTDEQRAKLIELAAQRGHKGYSKLVQDAVDAYLAEQQALASRPTVEASTPAQRGRVEATLARLESLLAPMAVRFATLLRRVRREAVRPV